MSYLFERKLSRADHLELEEELLERGELLRLEVEGWRGAQLMAAGDLPLLERLQRGDAPAR